jgi:predicted adenylyl cyclase CyaB
MPTNIEIKARVANFPVLQTRAEALSDTPVQVIAQEDIFFHVPQGRLKLRILSPNRAQLIFYHRPDSAGPKRSHYQIFETTDPAGLQSILTAALGVRGVVRKVRSLYLVGQTRIHLDDVEGLGQFIELEVVLHPHQSEAAGRAIAQSLMEKLKINPEDLIEGAYIDLAEQ